MIAFELDALARLAFDDAKRYIHTLHGKGKRIAVESDVLNLITHLFADLLQAFLASSPTREVLRLRHALRGRRLRMWTL